MVQEVVQGLNEDRDRAKSESYVESMEKGGERGVFWCILEALQLGSDSGYSIGYNYNIITDYFLCKAHK